MTSASPASSAWSRQKIHCAFTTAEWAEFLRDVREASRSATIETRPDDTNLHSAGATLRFTAGEWTAFRAGVLDGEFDLVTSG